jgi:hypothetical protein
MPWSNIKGHEYYYRKRRVGRRVISEYVGCGPLAMLTALLDAEDAEEREAQRESRASERRAEAEMWGEFHGIVEEARRRTRRAIEASGYAIHTGRWRKRRRPRDAGPQDAR